MAVARCRVQLRMATLGMMLAVLLAFCSGLASSQTQNSCTSPIPFANGKVSGYDTLYGSTLRFTCDDGSLLRGSDFSYCGDPCNGSVCTWVPALPHCQGKIYCPRPQLFPNVKAHPNGSNIRYNKNVDFSCNNGYHLVGSSFSHCTVPCNNSVCTWSHASPHCDDIDECASNPCRNGAGCKDMENFYTCQCTAGYTGMRCQVDIDECNATTHSCHPNANCHNRDGSYTCTCVNGFVGGGEHCNAQLRLPGDQAMDILVLEKNTSSSPWTLKKLYSNISPGDSKPIPENKEKKAYAFVMYEHGVAKGLQNVLFQEHNSSASEWAQQAINVTRVMDFNTADGTVTIHFRSLPWPTEDGVWMEYRYLSLTCYADEQPQSKCEWTEARVTNRYLPVKFSSGLSYEYRLYVVRGTESNGNKSNSTDVQRRRRSVDDSTRKYTVPLSFATNHHSSSVVPSASSHMYAGIGGGLALLACLGVAAFVIMKLRSRSIKRSRQELELKTSSQTTQRNSVASMTENAAYGTHLPQTDCTYTTTYCTVSEVEPGAPNHITMYEEVVEVQNRQRDVLEENVENDYELMDCAL